MPIYTYECKKCQAVFEAFNSIASRKQSQCPKCGENGDLTIGRPAAVHGFKLGWFEHIAHEPVYIKSKKHLKEECERRGCYAPGVLW